MHRWRGLGGISGSQHQTSEHPATTSNPASRKMVTTVLITGANRGIGKGFVSLYLSRPDHTIIAAARDPGCWSVQGFKTLPAAQGSKILLVKVDSASNTDALDAIKTIKAAGIDHLDLVIANAGIVVYSQPVATLSLADLRTQFEVNTFGPVRLFQATVPLLKAARDPKFVVISSVIGSTTDAVAFSAQFGLGSYGASKAAVNHLVRRMHFENEWLTALALHPGAVSSDMGAAAYDALGEGAEPSVNVEDSVNGQVKLIDNATRESISENGGFLSFDGSSLQY
ncbi:aflatoxin biosynthesis ketoreductase nor-1 [Cercophora newfieldiana]|uniref:Aflatoxin biosynthesis ketoreductase nor-1 n=1 Tax=Cercophora newfieldiana TaxID=92897 RepID=A0AA40CS18_9PEZI|nr:aflatoxin biosynthesis ketoreductase nor-1 [Cercophora newfieldiana]